VTFVLGLDEMVVRENLEVMTEGFKKTNLSRKIYADYVAIHTINSMQSWKLSSLKQHRKENF